MSGADASRAFLITEGIVLLGLVLAVFGEYSRTYWRTGRALPLHVALVSASYAVLLGLGLARTIGRLGEPGLLYEVYFRGIAWTLGIIGLVTMLVRLRTNGGGDE